jgi:thymidylate synthase
MYSIFKNTGDYEEQYKEILRNCLSNDSVYREDRTGVGCYSLFNQSMEFDVSNRFPVITGRKMFPKVFNTEMKWFLNGETNIERFKKAGVKIWDAWADENGDLGPVYGHQLRNFNSQGFDQMSNVIWSLCEEPDSRRHVISLWNPAQTDDMALPPCYLYFQFFVENGKLNMFVVQRSGDMYLGVPYDVALFTLIMNYVASKTGYKVGKLAMNIIDAHVYVNQIDAVNEYLDKPTFAMPAYRFCPQKGARLIGYEHGPHIPAPVAI